MFRQIVDKNSLWWTTGKNKKSMAYVGSIVHFIEHLINNGKGYQVYNYADKPDLSTKELIKIIEHSLSLKTLVEPSVISIQLSVFGHYLSSSDGLLYESDSWRSS